MGMGDYLLHTVYSAARRHAGICLTVCVRTKPNLLINPFLCSSAPLRFNTVFSQHLEILKRRGKEEQRKTEGELARASRRNLSRRALAPVLGANSARSRFHRKIQGLAQWFTSRTGLAPGTLSPFDLSHQSFPLLLCVSTRFVRNT